MFSSTIVALTPPPVRLCSIYIEPCGVNCNEPGAHDTHMCQGAVTGRAESILRSLEASALGNSVHIFKILKVSGLVASLLTVAGWVGKQHAETRSLSW